MSLIVLVLSYQNCAQEFYPRLALEKENSVEIDSIGPLTQSEEVVSESQQSSQEEHQSFSLSDSETSFTDVSEQIDEQKEQGNSVQISNTDNLKYTPSISEEVPGGNYNTEISWGEAFNLSHLINEFEVTEDPLKLIEFIIRAQKVIAIRDDKAGQHEEKPTWSVYKDSIYYSGPGMDGLILNPLANFLLLYSNRPELFDINTDEVDISGFTEMLPEFIQETLNHHQNISWNSSLGTYGTRYKVLDSQGLAIGRFGQLPFNLSNALGIVHMKYYLVTDDSNHLRVAAAIARNLKKNMISGPNNTIYWPYWMDGSGRPEDTSHAYITIEFLNLMAKNGVIFDWSILRKMNNTLRYHVLGSTDVVMGYIGGRKDISEKAGGGGGGRIPICQINHIHLFPLSA